MGVPKLVGFGSSKNMLCGSTLGMVSAIHSSGPAMGIKEVETRLNNIAQDLRAEMRRGMEEQGEAVASSTGKAVAAVIESLFALDAGQARASGAATSRPDRTRPDSLTHAAATSIIAKLVQERDEARAMLSQYRGPGSAPLASRTGREEAPTRPLARISQLDPLSIQTEPSSAGVRLAPELPGRESAPQEPSLTASGESPISRRGGTPRDALARRREKWSRSRSSAGAPRCGDSEAESVEPQSSYRL